MTEFESTNEKVTAAQLEQEGIEQLEAALDGWDPAEGDQLFWANKTFARLNAGVYGQAAKMEKGAFKRFGEAIISIPPVQASVATVESTWTMIDDAGYTIPAGTQVTIAASGETAVGFVTAADVVVAPEATMATVLLQAIEPGVAGNGLPATVGVKPELSDALAFVKEIAAEGVSANGVDPEDEDTYLNRLVEEIQTFSTSLILPRDFEIDARAVAGVFRAKCIRNYDADKDEGGVALCQSIFPIDASGAPLSTPAKEALLARQVAKLLTDVQHHVADPDYTEIDVTTSVVVRNGFDPAAVVAAVKARLAEYFNPARWGMPTQGDSGSGWENRTSVYRFELIAEIDRVGGVDRVITLKYAKDGGAVGTAEELVLTGVAPLTKPGVFLVTAS